MDKIREKLKLTVGEARELVWGDLPGFKTIEEQSAGSSRWSTHYRLVVQRESDKKFFADTYSVGSTESQEERPFEYTEPNFREVFPEEKVIIVYK